MLQLLAAQLNIIFHRAPFLTSDISCRWGAVVWAGLHLTKHLNSSSRQSPPSTCRRLPYAASKTIRQCADRNRRLTLHSLSDTKWFCHVPTWRSALRAWAWLCLSQEFGIRIRVLGVFYLFLVDQYAQGSKTVPQRRLLLSGREFFLIRSSTSTISTRHVDSISFSHSRSNFHPAFHYHHVILWKLCKMGQIDFDVFQVSFQIWTNI